MEHRLRGLKPDQTPKASAHVSAIDPLIETKHLLNKLGMNRAKSLIRFHHFFILNAPERDVFFHLLELLRVIPSPMIRANIDHDPRIRPPYFPVHKILAERAWGITNFFKTPERNVEFSKTRQLIHAENLEFDLENFFLFGVFDPNALASGAEVYFRPLAEDRFQWMETLGAFEKLFASRNLFLHGLLLHRNRFRQVPRLIHIPTVQNGDLVGEKLERDHGEDRGKNLRDFGNRKKIICHFS